MVYTPLLFVYRSEKHLFMYIKTAISGSWLFFFLLGITQVFAGNPENNKSDMRKSESIVEVLDSLTVNMENMNRTICIDSSVVLSCDEKKIFAYEWIDVSTGEIISTEPSLRVSPRTTTQYQLNLYFFSGELIPEGKFEDAAANRKVVTDYKKGYKNWSYAWEGRYELWPEGYYCIGTSPRNFHPYFYDIKDHTSGKGNMMVVNGSMSGNTIVWKTTVNVEKGRTYAFSAWGVEVGRNNPAQFHFTINGKTLGKDHTLKDEGEAKARWEQFYELWVADRSTAVISLVNLNTLKDGNDFAIDDISFASMEKKSGLITVQVLPAVKLGKLPDIVECEGTPVRVNAQATGTNITGYVWTQEGRVLPNTDAILDFPAAKVEDSGAYTCSVTGECGTRVEKFKMDIHENLRVGKLSDTIFPCEEEAVVLVTEATGYLPKFTWYPPGKGAGWEGTGNKYTNSKIYWSRDTGTYICEVTSLCGNATVSHRLEGRDKLKITAMQEDQTVCSGSDVRIFVETNYKPQRVDWIYPDKVTHTDMMDFMQTGVTEKDMGIFHCVLEGDCGEVVTGDVIVRLEDGLSNLKISGDTMVCENGKAVFQASAEGKGLSYLWTGPQGYRATASQIVIDPVTPLQEGTYRVVVRDSCGKQLTGEVTLAVFTEFEHLKLVENTEICEGEGVLLEVTGGEAGLKYVWTTPGGKVYNGATLDCKTGEEGIYVCQIEGICRKIEKPVVVSFKEPLKAIAGQDYFRVCPGENVVLQAEASGREVEASWFKEGVWLQNGFKLALNDIESGDAGIYQCKVHSACGDTVLQYVLEVRELLKVKDLIPGKYVRRGEAVSLFVNVEGDSERTYEWRLDGKVLAGKNSNYLNFTAPSRDTLLIYTFKAAGCNTEEVQIPVYVRDYHNLEQDTAIFLCEGSNWSCRAFEKPEDWCPDSEIKQYWLYQGDTVSYINALTFLNYIDTMKGEYVYTLESKCGKETLRLYVGTIVNTQIISVSSNIGGESGGSISACEGEDIYLDAEVEAGGLVTYEWRKDGEILKGANASRLPLGKVTASMGGAYSCRVISADCGEDTKGIDLKVYRKPHLTYEPLVEKCPGESITLSVATDADVLSEFTWSGPARNHWVAENNGYSATYKNTAAGLGDEGIYRCEVKGVCGVDTAVIRVNIEKDIIFSAVPQTDSVCPGARVELNLPLEQEEVKCSWILPDRSVVEGESVDIKYFSASNEGVYHYILETKKGCFTKEGDIRLSLYNSLSELVVSPDTAVCSGQSVWFSAFAAGKEISYEWLGPDGLRAEGPKVEISPVTESNVGIYEVIATDLCHTRKHARVMLALKKEFEDLQVSPGVGVCAGENVSLKVEGGPEKVKYEWLLGGKTVGYDAELEIRNIEADKGELYICRVSGECQTVEKEVNLQVYAKLVARKQDFLPVCEREDVVLLAEAEGEQVGYRWTKEGKEVGFRTNLLELKDVIPSDAGLYECQVTSLCGDTTLAYEFQLKERTRILRHSADRILCEDDDYMLMVECMGVNNRYTWKCDGRILPEKGSILECPPVGYADTLVYTCLVEGECGRDSMDVVIKIGEFRKINGDLSEVLCEGSNYKYNVDVIPAGAFEGMGFWYSWTFKDSLLYEGTSSIFPLVEVKPEDAGDYFCEITTLSDLIEKKSAKVKVHIDVMRLPRISSMTDNVYAIEGSNDSVQVKASGDELTYLWSKDGIVTAHTGTIWHFQPIAYEDRGSYQVTVSNACSRASRTAEVEVWRKTVIVYPQERADSVCRKDNIDLEVVAWGEVGLLYKWYLDGKLVDAPLTQPLKLSEADVDMNGTYLCVVEGRGGVDSCKIHLKVMELPEVGITGKFWLCREEADLVQTYTGNSSEGRVDYVWSVVGGEMVSAVHWDNTTVKWDNAEEKALTLEITSLTTGCHASRTESVTYYPVIETSIIVPDKVGYCLDSLKLDRAYPWGGDFYVNDEKVDVVYFREKDKAYRIDYLYVDEDTRCRSKASDTIQVADRPRLLMAQDTVISGWCTPVTLKIDEHSFGDIIWDGDQVLEVVQVEQAVYRPGAYQAEPLKFRAVLEDEYGCQASDSSVVVLLDSPRVRLMEDTVTGVCSELLLTGKYEAEEPVTVSWEPAGKLEVVDDYTVRLLENKVGTAAYRLSVTDRYGCAGHDEVVVTVQEAPVLEDKAICEGDSMVIDMGQYAAWEWGDGYPEAVRVLSRVGSYSVVVKDQFGCEGEAWYEVHALPALSLNDTMIFEGEKMEFVLEEKGEYGPYTFQWQDGSWGMIYTADKEGNYSVTVTDNLGCAVTDTAFLEVRKRAIAAPDAFLPNSSAENSRFYLKEVNFASNFEMYIYDRWGELLYKTNEIGFKGGWDGMFKGIHCQPGAYVWVAFVDGKEIGRGTLMLVK